MEACDKVQKDSDEGRFGPPTITNVRPLVDKVAVGSILFTDGARAYECVCKEYSLKWSSVDHSSGEFTRRQCLWGRERVVSTQGIDGAWGLLKTFLRARGGVYGDHLEGNVKEFQWRRNLGKDADPFISLLCCIRDGCFQ